MRGLRLQGGQKAAGEAFCEVEQGMNSGRGRAAAKWRDRADGHSLKPVSLLWNKVARQGRAPPGRNRLADTLRREGLSALYRRSYKV
jgi:hypothetical protein